MIVHNGNLNVSSQIILIKTTSRKREKIHYRHILQFAACLVDINGYYFQS